MKYLLSILFLISVVNVRGQNIGKPIDTVRTIYTFLKDFYGNTFDSYDTFYLKNNVLHVPDEIPNTPRTIDLNPYLDTIGKHIRFDTVRCMLLVCDTATSSVVGANDGVDTVNINGTIIIGGSLFKTYTVNDNSVGWYYGFMVYDVVYDYTGASCDTCLDIRFGDTFHFLKYLDSKKRPLNRSVIVWDSKKLAK